MAVLANKEGFTFNRPGRRYYGRRFARSGAPSRLASPRGSGYRDVVVIGGSALLLAANAYSFYTGAFEILWGTALLVLACTAVPFLATWRSPLARYFCWANIFAALLALFHIGYYVPVRLGLAEPLSYMPSVNSRVGDLAMLLYCCAVLSFALGVALSAAWSRHGDRSARPAEGEDPRLIWGVNSLGALIVALSLLLFLIYLVQIGGIARLFQLSYVDYTNFLTYADPRFLATFVSFMPVGLLLLYVALFLKGRVRRTLLLLDSASILYIAWLTLIGARGPAFLFALGVLYVRHMCRRPLSWKALSTVVIVLLFAIPLVRAYRNLPVGERLAAIEGRDITPLAGIMEMGSTYKTLYAFADLFGPGGLPPMMGESYIKAVEHLIPNLGLHKDALEADGYYRSNIWITEIVDPAAAAEDSGLGSTGIGEPFANFGYLGVVAFFVLLGIAIRQLETYTLRARSVVSAAAAASLFIPVNWYVRDDIYGTLRSVVWPLAAILAVCFICTSLAQGRAASRKAIPEVGGRWGQLQARD